MWRWGREGTGHVGRSCWWSLGGRVPNEHLKTQLELLGRCKGGLRPAAGSALREGAFYFPLSEKMFSYSAWLLSVEAGLEFWKN